MKRIDFIKDFANKKGGWKRKRNSLIRALVSSLNLEDAEDAARSLDPRSLNDPILRSELLQKVAQDIREIGFQTYHRTLIQNLISSFSSLPGGKMQSCGYFLYFLYDSLPSDLQYQALRLFISSRYVSMRRRGYKILRKNWSDEHKPSIEQAWHQYHEYYCATLIVDRFSDTFVAKHFDELEKVLWGNRGAAGLYIRVGTNNPDILKRLENHDGITFAYVMLKLGKLLSQKQALNIFEQYKFDDRIYLFIWCIARMKLWPVLEHIAKNSENLQKEEDAWFRKKFSIDSNAFGG